MCLHFRSLKKIIVKDKFPILVIDDLLDELKGAQLFTELDLYSDYHILQKLSHLPNPLSR
jgi:hypothetical protein